MLWTHYRPSKRAAFGFLMLLSALALVLPRSWSDTVKGAGQLLVPPMDWLYGLSHGAAKSLADLDPAQQENDRSDQALLHELASQVAVAEQLREENTRLRALRRGHVPRTLPLLPARIVARDIVAWRDSVLVERGASRGVRRKDWVASRFFVDQGTADGVGPGQVVLAGESLLGRVEQVSPYMARVQLFSDIDSPRLEVRIGMADGGTFDFVDYPCSLRGMGRGRMSIDDVPYQFVEAGADRQPNDRERRIRIGDYVFSTADQLGLAEPLVIGRIVELQEDPRKRLVFSLIIEPAASIDQLRDVFIIPLVPIGQFQIQE